MDVGHVFELYADFTQRGKAYVPFPDARSHRIKLADLAHPELRERLRLVWTTPLALDPSKQAAKVTREVAGYLAELANFFRESHEPKLVAEFLSRCLFCMFAEDVGLLPKAASLEWRHVEPVIFDTLLERALSPDERHKLGAHHTPRAYVDRLVLPTVIEPLRDEWAAVRIAAVTFAQRGDIKAAKAEVIQFPPGFTPPACSIPPAVRTIFSTARSSR